MAIAAIKALSDKEYQTLILDERRREFYAEGMRWQDINENTISAHLYTAGQADPDLLIRTGGEHRLSNFLLWQASYAELYFTDVKWPDFRKEQLLEAIACFNARQRRYGLTGSQLQEA